MIVITQIVDAKHRLVAGDEFCLSIDDATGCNVLIKEDITEDRVIDFAAAYRFVNDDGTCDGFHLAGIFGIREEMPEVIKNAKMFIHLSPEQQERFVNSVGAKPGAAYVSSTELGGWCEQESRQIVWPGVAALAIIAACFVVVVYLAAGLLPGGG